MHNATEDGVVQGLLKLAQTGQVGLVVEKDAIIVRDDATQVCDLAARDPYATVSEGSLVLALRPHRTYGNQSALADRGIPDTRVEETVPAGQGSRLLQNGNEQCLELLRVDPFWEASGLTLSRTREHPKGEAW